MAKAKRWPVRRGGGSLVSLPPPPREGGMSLEEALRRRRSVREFGRAPLTLAEVSGLLFAAQGITGGEGERTAPSAGALYPLEVGLVAGRVTGLAPGVYRYRPAGHALEVSRLGRFRARLASAALGQSCVATAAAVFFFAAVFRRTTATYGREGIRYVYLEAGHAAQNLCLEATALGLGAVAVGAVSHPEMRPVLALCAGERALYLVAVGR